MRFYIHTALHFDLFAWQDTAFYPPVPPARPGSAPAEAA